MVWLFLYHVMVKIELRIGDVKIKQIEFMYLGVTLTEGRICEQEIRRRIKIAKYAFGKH